MIPLVYLGPEIILLKTNYKKIQENFKIFPQKIFAQSLVQIRKRFLEAEHAQKNKG